MVYLRILFAMAKLCVEVNALADSWLHDKKANIYGVTGEVLMTQDEIPPGSRTHERTRTVLPCQLPEYDANTSLEVLSRYHGFRGEVHSHGRPHFETRPDTYQAIQTSPTPRWIRAMHATCRYPRQGWWAYKDKRVTDCTTLPPRGVSVKDLRSARVKAKKARSQHVIDQKDPSSGLGPACTSLQPVRVFTVTQQLTIRSPNFIG
jgi:hypothetical protein